MGLSLFSDATLWDDAPAQLARRLDLRPESITPGAETWRRYLRPPLTLLGAPAYMLALRNESGCIESFTIMFTNQGDYPAFSERATGGGGAGYVSPSVIKAFDAGLLRDFQNVRQAIAAALPNSERDPSPAQRRAAPGQLALFIAGEHELLLQARPGSLLALRIQPTERAAPPRLSDDQLRRRWKEQVTRRPNGDVILDRIPMVDQGPKGYCVPATFERLLRYAGIPADLYDLAALGGTAPGGGTNVTLMMANLERTVRQAGRRLEAIKIKPSPATLARYLDEGRPVLWSLSSTTDFNKLADTYSRERPAALTALSPWAKERRLLGSTLALDPTAAHLCLLIGYNRNTGELAFSDSWGPEFAERWLPAAAVQSASFGEFWVLNF
ncbi:MAG: C39 family peptidase [Verrucomicrobia bacterium]|nr:C39 family peptidase [Verrucomicrobiota bacterium]